MVSVADTGVGMSNEQLQRLFGREIFSTRGTQNEKGTGLGLVLIKEFVNIMNSEIELVKSDSNGTIFTFVIDLYK